MPKDAPGHKGAVRGSKIDMFHDFVTQGPVRVMGIVNVTPDSFSDGGHFYNADNAIAQGLALLEAGADILDIGGESTRPGAKSVDIEEEIARVVPVIEGLCEHAPWISIDTRNAATMQAALIVGANIINDVSALTHDPKSVCLVKEAETPVILMHAQGSPKSMQHNPNYNNVVEDVLVYLEGRISYCETHGIDKRGVVIDPGIGFGKTLEHNLSILQNLNIFSELSTPVILGASRKSFIGDVTGENDPEKRLGGSLASALIGVEKGARIVRVHDVEMTVQALKTHQAISEAGSA
ncbi:MAG: dihydropteroate synthase [Pseudomonadota bacterium]